MDMPDDEDFDDVELELDDEELSDLEEEMGLDGEVDMELTLEEEKEMSGINDEELEETEYGDLSLINRNEVAQELLMEISDSIRDSYPAMNNVERPENLHFGDTGVEVGPLHTNSVNGGWDMLGRTLTIQEGISGFSDTVAPTLLHEEWHADQSFRYGAGHLEKTYDGHLSEEQESIAREVDSGNEDIARELLRYAVSGSEVGESYAEWRENGNDAADIIKPFVTEYAEIRQENDELTEELESSMPEDADGYSEPIEALVTGQADYEEAINQIDTVLKKQGIEESERDEAIEAVEHAYGDLKYNIRKEMMLIEDASDRLREEVHSDVTAMVPEPFAEGFAHAATLAYRGELTDEDKREDYLESKTDAYSQRLGDNKADAMTGLTRSLAEEVESRGIEDTNQQLAALHEMQEEYAESFWTG